VPYVNVKTVKGMLDEHQKRQLMSRIGDVLVEIEGGGNPEFRKLVWIHIDESEPSDWQIGELQPTAQYIAAVVQKRDAQRNGGSHV
jgi:4-oxalocrotonate tautomerase